MIDRMIAQRVEQELCGLFGEAAYQLEVSPCSGKYRGHTDYTLVFGSGRRLYVGLDERNYVNSLYDHLRAIRHFRAHQAENTRRINAVLKEHNTPYCRASVEVIPYGGTSNLTLYAAVILNTSGGMQFVYRTFTMHGFLVGYEAPCYAFDGCMAHLLQDARGKMAYTSVLTMKDAA